MILRVKVKDGMMGYYAHKRWKEGRELVLEKASDFSHTWMEAIGWEPPVKSKKLTETEKLKLEISELKEKLNSKPEVKKSEVEDFSNSKKKPGNTKEVI